MIIVFDFTVFGMKMFKSMNFDHKNMKKKQKMQNYKAIERKRINNTEIEIGAFQPQP